VLFGEVCIDAPSPELADGEAAGVVKALLMLQAFEHRK
jgi:hypothetical protein